MVLDPTSPRYLGVAHRHNGDADVARTYHRTALEVFIEHDAPHYRERAEHALAEVEPA
jgi:hypothetical protein